MTNTETDAELRFDPPGPGSWGLDPVHFPRPVTRYWAETHPEAFIRGTNDFARFYGMLIDGMRDGLRQRIRLQHHGAGPRGARSHERFQRAEEVFEKKLWREQLQEWDETVKPSAIAAHRADPGHRS